MYLPEETICADSEKLKLIVTQGHCERKWKEISYKNWSEKDMMTGIFDNFII